MDLCLKASVRNSSLRAMFFVQKIFSNSKSFLAHRKRWDELRWTFSVLEWETVLPRWHVREDGKRWEELRWSDMRWEEIRWFQMRWAVECEVQVWSVKCGVWRVQCEVWRNCSLDVALQRDRTLVMSMFLDSNSRHNKFAPSTHARAWQAHGACKFYRWKRSYSQI